MLAPESLPALLGIVSLLALIAYAILGGADFGGGVWDLLARGPRAEQHRAAVAEAMGPVWEANHVWLIFLIVLLFVAFPPAFATLSVALFWPFHLVLAGIVLRGAAFVFSAHGRTTGEMPLLWGAIFGSASALTPVLLGAALGAVSAGNMRVVDGVVTAAAQWSWLSPFPLATGGLALAVCAYLAAVYLTIETEGEVRADFRRRALAAWLAGGALSVATLLLTYLDAPRLWAGLTSPPAGLVVGAGALLAPASALALWRQRYHLARFLAIVQVVLLLVGWALAQWSYLIYPDLSLAQAAAPTATLWLVVVTMPFGLALLLPSLWLLFVVFKGRNPVARGEA